MYIPTLDPVLVGKVIAYFRQQSGMSQEVLSGLAVIGRTHLSAIERGERRPTLETFYRICMAMNVKMSTVILKLEEELAKESTAKEPK
ncbi:MAG: helix-turn-helix domain-containing protein [Candidatus Merdivicinus sp.]